MATFIKFNCFVEDLGKGVHNFSSHVCKVMLTNTAPVATMTVKTDFTDLGTNYGYTAGGNVAANSSGWTQAGGVAKLTLGDPATWTAIGGAIGPFRYAVLYNDTSATDALIGAWDYGSSISLQSGETFTVDLDASNGVLTVGP